MSSNMEVILKEDIKGLGYKNDVVSVRGGYGRNFLIPKRLAIIANKSNKKHIEETIKQMAHKAEKQKADAEDMANSMEDVTLKILTKAGETGKIFGAITALQVSDALRDKGFFVDRKKISFKEPIKTLGQHHAILDLHKEVKKEIAIEVEAE